MDDTGVLLIHTNREQAPYPAVPLGLCLVASALERAGFTPRVLDLCFSRRPERDIERALQEWRPEAIGIAIRNLDNGESLVTREYLPEVVRFARLCRERTPAPIVIGGPAVSIAPTELLAATGADYAVIGDGEQAMPELLASIARGNTGASIPGVCSPGNTRAAVPARVVELGSLPPAQLGKWLDVRRYLRHGAPMPIQTRRGCGFTCTYCTYRFIEGTVYRLRPPEAVAEELADATRRLGARHFDIIDSTFNRPAEHAVAVCEAIARRGVRADLQTTGFNPAGVCKDLVAVMKRAGFSSIVCTPEAGSDRMLASLRKGFNSEEIRRVAGWAHEAELPVLWMFMFGGPGECEETVRETVRLIEAIVGPRDRVICTIGLRIYPGTELERTAVDEAAIAPGTDLSGPVFYFSPQISSQRVLRLLDGCSVRSRMVYLETLQQPLVAWTARLRSTFRLPGKLWSAVPLYNRLVWPFLRGVHGDRAD